MTVRLLTLQFPILIFELTRQQSFSRVNYYSCLLNQHHAKEYMMNCHISWRRCVNGFLFLQSVFFDLAWFLVQVDVGMNVCQYST